MGWVVTGQCQQGFHTQGNFGRGLSVSSQWAKSCACGIFESETESKLEAASTRSFIERARLLVRAASIAMFPCRQTCWIWQSVMKQGENSQLSLPLACCRAFNDWCKVIVGAFSSRYLICSQVAESRDPSVFLRSALRGHGPGI